MTNPLANHEIKESPEKNMSVKTLPVETGVRNCITVKECEIIEELPKMTLYKQCPMC